LTAKQPFFQGLSGLASEGRALAGVDPPPGGLPADAQQRMGPPRHCPHPCYPGRALLEYAVVMPKMKSHSGAKKRFRKTGTGKLRARHAMTSHILEKKNAKRKRRLARPVEIAKADEPRVKELLR
jgi:large subunit ribosomal protein L35